MGYVPVPPYPGQSREEYRAYLVSHTSPALDHISDRGLIWLMALMGLAALGFVALLVVVLV